MLNNKRNVQLRTTESEF